MCAKPGTKNYGAYTVKLNLFAESTGRFAVSEGNFFPPPRVKSAVIRLDRTDTRVGMDLELQKAIMTMADACFANRRKTISNSCKSYFSNPQTANQKALAGIQDIFAEASIAPNERGEHLELAQYVELGKAYLACLNAN